MGVAEAVEPLNDGTSLSVEGLPKTEYTAAATPQNTTPNRSCELKEPGAPEPQCCLCPVVGGALKPTTIPGAWCHNACMQWVPEVSCVDPMR